ncbi:hypothetical protein DFH11DRAFT_1883212 [Phellopilus nigrolimitatus]|nr:hypothetical protein DFH11DRAFT_1883212 [Phellopilus nigrolimitatus]
MSSLTVALPDGRELVLSGVDGQAPPGHRHVRALSGIQDNYNSTIYQSSGLDGKNIVLKMCAEPYFEDVKYEAEVYHTLLRPFQGTIVPTVLGFYVGEEEAPLDSETAADARGSAGKGKGRRKRRVGCIVQEYCGMLIDKIANQSLDDRYEILKQIGRLHRAGLHMTVDLSGNNIVRGDDGVFRLVHFQDLQRHACPWDGDWHMGESAPELAQFKCTALYELAQEFGIWKHHQFAVVVIQGQTYLDVRTSAHEVVETRKTPSP